MTKETRFRELVCPRCLQKHTADKMRISHHWCKKCWPAIRDRNLKISYGSAPSDHSHVQLEKMMNDIIIEELKMPWERKPK